MITWDKIVGGIFLIWVFIHTMSYGKWTWNKKNHFGAFMVFMIGIATLALPIYQVFFK